MSACFITGREESEIIADGKQVMKCQLAPSMLAADFNCLGRQLKELVEAGVEVLHIDVMDGMFVPSISFGMPVISSLREETQLFFDVHLMVQEPIRYISEFRKCGADSITVHIEACENMQQTLDAIRECGAKTAISLCPDTPLTEIDPYLEEVDMVLVMTVNPGFGGQKMIPDSLDKVLQLNEIRTERNLQYRIEIDGGVTKDNLAELIHCGADWVVAGTAVFRGEIKENVSKLKEVIAHAS